ncbi:hypothetical protein [Neorhizobium sp. DAR64861/K0K2]|uniref:hypothetical protein n=1 Tax=unclassified Neorhizobium TaxID=2629175 RepID=UPI003D2E4C0B
MIFGTKTKQVISVRTDGFGARLMALIHGMYVAEQLDLPFKFSWLPMKGDSQFHAVSSVRNIFSESFLAEHYDDSLDLSKYREIVHEPLSDETIKQVLQDKNLHGINMMVCEDQLKFKGADIPREVFPRIWQKIDFSDRLKEIIAKAEAAVPGNAVAVHARRGDTISGVYRMRLFNERYVPISWFKTIFRGEADKGSPLLLFSDDSRILQMMRDRYSVGTTDDFGAGEYTSEERAVFDFAMMSRCSRIIARGSTYAILASLINKVPRYDPREAFDIASRRLAILDDVESNPDDYTTLDKAKELQWVANELSEGLTYDQRDSLLSRASELDPENQTYNHLRALTFARRKLYKAAEDILREQATAYFESNGGRSQEFMHPFNLMGDRIARPFLEPATIGEHPFISLFYAHNLTKREGAEAALVMFRRSHLLEPASDVLLANYAQALLACKKHDEALDPLASAIRAGRNLPIFHRQIIECYEAAGKKDMALKHAGIAFELAPEDAFIRTKYAFLLTRARRNEEAKQAVEGMTQDSTNDPAALFQLSRALERFGNKALAKECAGKAVQLRPRKGYYRKWFESL